jgi:hypothetical protein
MRSWRWGGINYKNTKMKIKGIEKTYYHRRCAAGGINYLSL